MRRLRLGALAAAGAVTVAVVSLAPAGAVGGTSFTALARADAFRIAVYTTGGAVTEVTDTSGPSAQAKIDSVGESVGFAALPYPGDTATTTPGLVLSLVAPQLGQSPPSYPLVARSQYPGDPDAQVSHGPVTLTAKSTQRSSEGHAAGAGADSGGNAMGKAAADTSVEVDDGGRVAVEASTVVESFTVGNVLRIGSMSASARAESRSGARPTTKSTFDLSGMTVAGTAVGLSEKGLVLAGTGHPLPDGSSLAKALASAGIQVSYVAPVTGDGFVQSAGVDVTAVQRLPSGNTVTVRYSLGRARAFLVGAAPAATVDSGAAGEVMLAPDPGTAPADGRDDAAPAATGRDVGAAPAPTIGSSVAEPGAAPTTERSGPAAVTAASDAGPVSTTSSASLYLVLVVGSAVAVSGSVLLRHFAVRLAWTS